MIEVRNQKEVAAGRQVIDWKGSHGNFLEVIEILYLVLNNGYGCEYN